MTTIQSETRLLADIHIPKRHRQDLGDLGSLMASMATIGLLHPVVITPDDWLIAGARRLEAAKRLGWTEIPVHMLDLAKLLQGEYDENEVRKDFTITEKVAIGEALEAQIAAENAARQQEGRKKGGQTGGRRHSKAATNGHSLRVNHAQAIASSRAQRTDTQSAQKARLGESRYTKAKAVMHAAKADPEQYGHLPAQMDATNNVSAAYRELPPEFRTPSTTVPRKPKPLTISAILLKLEHFIEQTVPHIPTLSEPEFQQLLDMMRHYTKVFDAERKEALSDAHD